MTDVKRVTSPWGVVAVAVAALLALSAVGGWWAWPKSVALPVGGGEVGYYRGLGLTDDDTPLFGRSFYLVTFPTDDVQWRVQITDAPYCPFRAFYPDGTLAAEGECIVEWTSYPLVPSPFPHDVQWGRFYRPDGTLASEVQDGTGVQMLFEPDGMKTWELQLRDHMYAHLTMWHPNGQLQTVQLYKDGVRDGPWTSYYPSGAKEGEGAYAAGARIGTWVRYAEDGTVRSVEENGDGEWEPRRTQEMPTVQG